MANLVIKNKNNNKSIATPETQITLENIISTNNNQKIALSNYDNTFKIKIDNKDKLLLSSNTLTLNTNLEIANGNNLYFTDANGNYQWYIDTKSTNSNYPNCFYLHNIKGYTAFSINPSLQVAFYGNTDESIDAKLLSNGKAYFKDNLTVQKDEDAQTSIFLGHKGDNYKTYEIAIANSKYSNPNCFMVRDATKGINKTTLILKSVEEVMQDAAKDGYPGKGLYVLGGALKNSTKYPTWDRVKQEYANIVETYKNNESVKQDEIKKLIDEAVTFKNYAVMNAGNIFKYALSLNPDTGLMEHNSIIFGKDENNKHWKIAYDNSSKNFSVTDLTGNSWFGLFSNSIRLTANEFELYNNNYDTYNIAPVLSFGNSHKLLTPKGISIGYDQEIDLSKGDRVELSVINPSGSVAEIWLGNDSQKKWSIGSRNSYDENNNLCIYSSKTGGYALTIGKDDFLGLDRVVEINSGWSLQAFDGTIDSLRCHKITKGYDRIGYEGRPTINTEVLTVGSSKVDGDSINNRDTINLISGSENYYSGGTVDFWLGNNDTRLWGISCRGPSKESWGATANNLCIVNTTQADPVMMRFNKIDNDNYELVSYIPQRTTKDIVSESIIKSLVLKATSKVHSKYRVNIGLDGEVFDLDADGKYQYDDEGNIKTRFWDRAELFLVSPADRPCDIWFGSIKEDLPEIGEEHPTFSNSDLKWSINVRNATDDNPYAFSIFNNKLKNYALQIKEEDLSILINEGLVINKHLNVNGDTSLEQLTVNKNAIFNSTVDILGEQSNLNIEGKNSSFTLNSKEAQTNLFLKNNEQMYQLAVAKSTYSNPKCFMIRTDYNGTNTTVLVLKSIDEVIQDAAEDGYPGKSLYVLGGALKSSSDTWESVKELYKTRPEEAKAKVKVKNYAVMNAGNIFKYAISLDPDTGIVNDMPIVSNNNNSSYTYLNKNKIHTPQHITIGSNLGQRSPGRTELSIVNPSSDNSGIAEIWLGYSNVRKWSISSRLYESKYDSLCIYSMVKPGYVLTIDPTEVKINNATTLSSTLSVTGKSTLKDTEVTALTATSATLSSALNVGGATTLRSGLTVSDSKATSLTGTLTVTGKTTLNNATQIYNTLTVSGNYATSLGGTLTVTGNTTLNGKIIVGSGNYGKNAPTGYPPYGTLYFQII